MSITKENWSYTHLISGNLQVQIHEAYSLSPQEGAIKTEFCVTEFNKETYQDLFQRDFSSIEEALACIHSRYSNWKSSSEVAEPSGSGCDSCQAH
mgnify:CR=1 FL=1